MSTIPPPPRPAMGSRIIQLESTPSTNDVAKQLLRAGEPHGTVVVADEQTKGRGRRGRRWASPRGGLWASLVARPVGLPAARAGMLNLAAAVAAAEAAAAVSGVSVRLKWPNDLLVAGRKLGGVLVETGAAAANVERAVIGVGINANVPLDTMPRSLRGVVASLHEEAGHEIEIEVLLRELCARTDDLLQRLDAGDDDEIASRWRALDTTPGRRVHCVRPRRWSGRVQGIDARGQLVVRTRGGLITIATSAGVTIE